MSETVFELQPVHYLAMSLHVEELLREKLCFQKTLSWTTDAREAKLERLLFRSEASHSETVVGYLCGTLVQSTIDRDSFYATLAAKTMAEVAAAEKVLRKQLPPPKIDTEGF